MPHFVIDMACVLENSFLNFHAKGLHYLCLRRTPDLTEKLYFLDGGACDGDAVVPHDHRYDFTQAVVHGRCTNILYEESGAGAPCWRYRYDTPLNGGGGFFPDGVAGLKTISAVEYGPGEFWHERAEEIHTIRCEPGTILHQRQYADRVATPTVAYSSSPSLPSTDGLYDHMTDSAAFDLLRCLVAAGCNIEVIAP